MKLAKFFRTTAIIAALSLAAPLSVTFTTTPLQAQGVPTIDTKNLLQQLKILERLAVDAGLQTDQIAKLVEQIKLLEEQYAKLQEIENLLKNPTEVLGLAMGIDLDGLLEGEFDVEMLSTIIKGAKGDWSNIPGKMTAKFEGLVDGALKGGGTTKEKVAALANSDDLAAQRNATATTSNAATSAAAEIAYEEAGQSVKRVTVLVEEIGKMDTLKESVDHNTRVTAELAIAMAALWQLESVQTMNVGLAGVLDAATLADIEKFTDFTPVEF